MRRRVAVLVVVLGGMVPLQVGAQATGMPSYNAPYRAFQRSELGAVFSFPNGGGTGFEGAYRYASGTLDIGLRGGIFDPSGAGKAVLLVGAEARERVITHTIDFPLDGAIVFGAGAGLVSGGSTLYVPVGLSLGRRVDPRGSTVSIVPYVQPTVSFVAGSGRTSALEFGFRADAEAKLQRRGAAAASDERDGGLYIGHDAHCRSARIHAAPERQTHRNEQRRAAAHEAGPRAEHDRAVERKVDRMRDHALARLHSHQEHGLPRSARIENAAAEPEVEGAPRVAVHALEPRAAAVGEAEHGPQLRPLKRAIGRVVGRHARSLCPHAEGEHSAQHCDQHRHATSHARLLGSVRGSA